MAGVSLPLKTGMKFASPFRRDRNPSCELWRAPSGEVILRDWSNGESFDAIRIYAAARGLTNAEAIRELLERLNLNASAVDICVPPNDASRAAKRLRWPEFRKGSRRELRRVAELRGIAVEGVELAQERGLLRFGNWRGQACWIVTDECRSNAQARCLDGKPFVVNRQTRKADTLPGSVAGLLLGQNEAVDFPAIALVEGGPDLIAAHGCIWAEGRSDVAAVGLLGASHRPKAEAWATFAQKRVRVYVHADDAGVAAARAWAKAILTAGATDVDGFRFDGLRKVNGSSIADLNDLFELHPDDFEARRDVWEVLP